MSVFLSDQFRYLQPAYVQSARFQNAVCHQTHRRPVAGIVKKHFHLKQVRLQVVICLSTDISYTSRDACPRRDELQTVSPINDIKLRDF